MDVVILRFIFTSGLDGSRVSEINLGGQFPRLFGRCHTTEDRLFTVKVPDNLLQCSVSCLDIELPHNEEFEKELDVVDDVVLLFDMRQRN